jgi:precorrin-6A/cobalt-precorrin-6A reductase
MRILILGGTSDANQLAAAVSAQELDAVYSYAGRTSVPAPQPLPTRTGGFGGVEGLAAYLQSYRFTHVIDATHPFAAEMSRNAVAACEAAGVRLLALERAEWAQEDGDRWIDVDDLSAAAAALPQVRARVFLAIGRQHLAPFAGQPQHTYTLRFVDEPSDELPFPDAHVIVDRGPFSVEGEIELLTAHGIEWVVTRNSGGEGAYAKIIAARRRGLPVIMIGRPSMPCRNRVQTVSEALDWLAHETCLGA